MNPTPRQKLKGHRVRHRGLQFKPAAPILPEVWRGRDTSAASHATPPELRYSKAASRGALEKKGRAGMNLRALSFNKDSPKSSRIAFA